ncbi:enoyl-[acyl-carrier-protein] reductase FabK [Caldanaerobacter sp.]|uniref:enoyl-[acyl-carrier-protein] reductase FabK n=1 Tax=Caldanaerobacter sp. TaxID=2930036 RepID=UPI003C77EDFB
MFKTKITELLDIEYPILQGGMAWVATAELAAAVSNAGGLGIIGAGNAPGSFVREQIKKAKELTDKPFGVNVMLLSPFVDEVMEVILEEGVKVITTGAGNPGKYIPKLKERGIKVIPVVASVALAKRMEDIGADAVVAEGMESGGHIGELTTFALVPQVVDAVSIPVIAAGGIADGRGFAAALCLGASGVQMGTRFVCSTECTAHPRYKEYIIKAKDRDTVVTGRSTGHPVRVLRNRLSREFEKLEQMGASKEELEKLGEGKLKAAVVDGDVEYGSVMAGQIAGLIKDIKPVKEIIEDIIEEAARVIENLNKMR